MVRVKNWCPPDGGDAIVNLTPCLRPQLLHVLKHGVYPSINMKTGIDMDYLGGMVPTLTELLRLDPRGGYFLQADVRRAMQQICLEKEFKLALNTLATNLKLTEYNTAERVAYAYRVMCSHVREKFDGRLKQNSPLGKDSVLSEVFDIMQNQLEKMQSTKRATRTRVQRNGSFGGGVGWLHPHT
eukprot:5473945-Pyramimonas_sp.AAC.1